MKYEYGSFVDVARDYRAGAPHAFSSHGEDDCVAWQQGVVEFAEFLDRVGVEVAWGGVIQEALRGEMCLD